MPDEETTLEWFDAEGLRDPLALRDFFAGEHFDPQAVVYLRGVHRAAGGRGRSVSFGGGSGAMS